jgi:hypothetical protein
MAGFFMPLGFKLEMDEGDKGTPVLTGYSPPCPVRPIIWT